MLIYFSWSRLSIAVHGMYTATAIQQFMLRFWSPTSEVRIELMSGSMPLFPVPLFIYGWVHFLRYLLSLHALMFAAPPIAANAEVFVHSTMTWSYSTDICTWLLLLFKHTLLFCQHLPTRGRLLPSRTLLYHTQDVPSLRSSIGDTFNEEKDSEKI
jgi:hypothetical protein